MAIGKATARQRPAAIGMPRGVHAKSARQEPPANHAKRSCWATRRVLRGNAQCRVRGRAYGGARSSRTPWRARRQVRLQVSERVARWEKCREGRARWRNAGKGKERNIGQYPPSPPPHHVFLPRTTPRYNIRPTRTNARCVNQGMGCEWREYHSEEAGGVIFVGRMPIQPRSGGCPAPLHERQAEVCRTVRSSV